MSYVISGLGLGDDAKKDALKDAKAAASGNVVDKALAFVTSTPGLVVLGGVAAYFIFKTEKRKSTTPSTTRGPAILQSGA